MEESSDSSDGGGILFAHGVYWLPLKSQTLKAQTNQPKILAFLPLQAPELCSRDRIVVSTLRCGRSNPGSNPGHGSRKHFFLIRFSFQSPYQFNPVRQLMMPLLPKTPTPILLFTPVSFYHSSICCLQLTDERHSDKAIGRESRKGGIGVDAAKVVSGGDRTG